MTSCWAVPLLPSRLSRLPAGTDLVRSGTSDGNRNSDETRGLQPGTPALRSTVGDALLGSATAAVLTNTAVFMGSRGDQGPCTRASRGKMSDYCPEDTNRTVHIAICLIEWV